MSLTPNQPDSKRELAPAGTHRAVLYKIINYGNVPTEWNGETSKKHKIRLIWELSDETIEYEKDGEKVTAPFSVGRKFTFSMGDNSNLYPIVQGITGGLKEDERWNFNIESLLGTACLLTVVHDEFNGNKYAKVTSATQLPKSMEAPKQVNENEVEDVRDLSQEQIEALPDFIKDEMKQSDEYHVRFVAPRGDGDKEEHPSVKEAREVDPEDIPF